MKDEDFKNKVTKGKNLSWREIFKICEKKYQKKFFNKCKLVMKTKRVKDLRRQYKPNIKIERTRRETSKVIVKLPKHIRNSKSLRQILKQKFCHEKKVKKHKHHHHIRKVVQKTIELKTPEHARDVRRIKKMKKRRLVRIEKRLIRRLKRKSQKYVHRKCTFSRVCRCNIKGKKVAYTKPIDQQKLFKKGCSVRRRCKSCPQYDRIKKLKAYRYKLIQKLRRFTRRPTKITKLNAILRNKHISRAVKRRTIIKLRKIRLAHKIKNLMQF